MIDWPNNTAQIFNEVSLLIICTMMFNFTDHIPDPKARYQIGWYFLYLIYFNVGVNLTLVAILIIRKVTVTQRRNLAIKR